MAECGAYSKKQKSHITVNKVYFLARKIQEEYGKSSI